MPLPDGDQSRSYAMGTNVTPVIRQYVTRWVMLACMTIESILSEIDAEIARLTQVRKLLGSSGANSTTAPKHKAAAGSRKGRKPRVLSAEARKRIADAQRKRWAAQRAKAKKEAA
jgi:hypothetical protein